MGNLPSAAKHCLNYQQLLREHLWSGDSVAVALDPAQVPSRGLGRPHPHQPHPHLLCLCHLCKPGPFLRPILLSVCGSVAEKPCILSAVNSRLILACLAVTLPQAIYRSEPVCVYSWKSGVFVLLLILLPSLAPSLTLRSQIFYYSVFSSLFLYHDLL